MINCRHKAKQNGFLTHPLHSKYSEYQREESLESASTRAISAPLCSHYDGGEARTGRGTFGRRLRRGG